MWLFRYGVLLPEDHERKDPLSMSVTILRQYDILPEMYQVGFTKLYFRAGQVSFFFLSFSSIPMFSFFIKKYFDCHKSLMQMQLVTYLIIAITELSK